MGRNEETDMGKITHQIAFEDGGSLSELAEKANQFYGTIAKGSPTAKQDFSSLANTISGVNDKLAENVKQGAKAAKQTEELSKRAQFLKGVQEGLTQEIENQNGVIGKAIRLLTGWASSLKASVAESKKLTAATNERIKAIQAAGKANLLNTKGLKASRLAAGATRVAFTALSATLLAVVAVLGVLAVGVLKNNKIADQARVVFAGVNAVVDTLLNYFGDLAGIISTFWNEGFTEGWKELKTVVSGVAGEFRKNIDLYTETEKALQRLRDAQIAYTLSLSAGQTELSRYSRILSDETRSFQEREEAAKNLTATERRIAQQRVDIATEQLRLNAKSKLSTEEFTAALVGLKDQSRTAFKATGNAALSLNDDLRQVFGQNVSPEALQGFAEATRDIFTLQDELREVQFNGEERLADLQDERREKYRAFLETRKEAEQELADFRANLIERLQDAELNELEGEARIRFQEKVAQAEIDELERVARERFKAAGKAYDLDEEFAELRLAISRQTEREISKLQLEEQVKRKDALERAAEADVKAALDNLRIREQVAQKQIDLQEDVADEELGLEQSKNRQRLVATLRFAKERQQILTNSLPEGSPELELITLEIQELQEAINEIDNINLSPLERLKSKILKALNLSEEDFKVITDALGQVVNNALAGIEALREARLSQLEQTIAGIDAQIEGLRSRLEIEEEREKDGFANSADALRESLEEQNQAREKAERERLNLERKAANQRLAIESAQQISAATLTISRLLSVSALQGLPGILLAATTGLATVFSIISRAKAQAQQFSEAPEFREGGSIVNGLLLGPSHEGGGIPGVYSDNQGRKRMVNLEGNEFVVNRNDAAKNMPLLEAINSGVDQDGLRRVLMEGVTLEGINFNSGIQKLMGNGGREIVLNNNSTDKELAERLSIELRGLRASVESREEFISHGGELYQVDRSGSVPRLKKAS